MSPPGRDAGRYRVAHLHQPTGWLSPGYLEIEATGTIAVVEASLPAAWSARDLQRLDGYVVPGMVNLHSHAHQRGLAGRAEGIAAAGNRDTFWTWRARMYEFVAGLLPDHLQAIAAQAYLEMLKAGFTTVGEFHYLHHDRDGHCYDNPAELADRILAAADETGIGLTLLPTLYTHGGIGRPPAAAHRRFVHEDVEDYLRLVERVSTRRHDRPLLRVGVAPHSLRAVSSENLRRLTAAMADLDPGGPIHIHVAEQPAEVEECLAGLGARPAEWLLDNLPVDARWTFVHATHCRDAERRAMVRRGVVVGLCPLTEADLGDGVFPLREYHRGGGAWGIGTDSNIAIGAAEELRMLEYVQRLRRRRRDVLVTPGDETTEHPGRLLYDLALAGGARSVSQPVGAIRPGKRADLVELDPDDIPLLGHTPRTVLDGWVFSGGASAVRNVMVAGTWVVRDRHHDGEFEIVERFRSALEVDTRS